MAKLLRIRPLHATILTFVGYVPQVLNEVERQFGPGEDVLKQFIRVVGIPSPMVEAAIETYQNLFSGKSVKQTSPDSDIVYNTVPLPNLVILDFFCYPIMTGIRNISGTSVPIYAWQSSTATAVMRTSGPERFGGTGDLLKKTEKIKADTDKEWVKEMNRLWERVNGDIVQVPGLPKMYDHEFFPQPPRPYNKTFGQLRASAFRCFQESDGILMATSSLWEGPSIDSWRDWFGSKPVLIVGALSLPASAEEIGKMKETIVGREVEKFLNDILELHGQHAVVYISFGSLWWPEDTEKVFAVVNEFLDEGIPFSTQIFGSASSPQPIPEDLLKKIEASGSAYHARWVPQQYILHHKALGWFLTHAGHNSTMEALAAGVPQICWPLQSDHPVSAVLTAWVHGVGYELFEVRSGQGLKPVRRLEGKQIKGTIEAVKEEIRVVMESARGDDGKLKRSKAQWFAKQFASAFQPGGEHYEDIKKILDVLP
ncbi:UDP-Glycosyltransferase/glycogen phosphorylase [Tricholoma matsutake]|nr:UDP-Glycosyltransferase/glycogen phosphorylase [Tricholoma matsutake 945]